MPKNIHSKGNDLEGKTTTKVEGMAATTAKTEIKSETKGRKNVDRK